MLNSPADQIFYTPDDRINVPFVSMKIQNEVKGEIFRVSENLPSAPLIIAGSYCCVDTLKGRILAQEDSLEERRSRALISFRNGDPARFHPFSTVFVTFEFILRTRGTDAGESEYTRRPSRAVSYTHLTLPTIYSV